MADRPRVTWVVSHPIQYQVPVFRAIAAEAVVDLNVLYLTSFGTRPSRDPQFDTIMQWDVPLLSGYRWRFVSGAGPECAPLGDIRPTSLRGELARGPQAVVVSGYGRAGYVWAISQARRQHCRIIHLGESNHETHVRSPLRRLLKRHWLRWVYGRRDHALSPGIRSDRYLQSYGVSPSRIHRYPYCVDTSLTDAAWPSREKLRASRRAALGIGKDQTVLLFCGKLIRKKDPLAVLHAFLSADIPAHLVFVGTGAEEGALRAAAANHGRVHFLGFVNQTDLPAVYAAADVVILPSVISETWGLVVNEAMAMGCAAIVSDRVGCAPEIVEGRDTGLVVPAGNLSALREAMIAAGASPGRLRLWQANARAVVSGYTPARAATAVADAVTAT